MAQNASTSPAIGETTDREVHRAARQRLEAEGIGEEILAAIARRRYGHTYAMARTREIGNGLFEYDLNGEWRCVVPEFEGGELVDLIAFSLDEPQRLTSLRGLAVMLGEEEAHRAAFVTEAAVVWETPLQWLRSGGEGGVIVDFRRPPWFLATCTITTTSLLMARRLKQAYAEPSRLPTLLVDASLGRRP